MTKKVVLKVEIYDNKEKQKALKAVSSLSGIESLAMDMKEKKLSVIGDVDPVNLVSKLRKFWHTEIVTVGPAKEPEKKKEDDKKKEDEKSKGDDGKKQGDDKKKAEEEKLKKEQELAELIKMYRNYNLPYYPYNYSNQYAQHQHHQQQQLSGYYTMQQQQQQPGYYTQHHYNGGYTSAEDNPNSSSCVIS